MNLQKHIDDAAVLYKNTYKELEKMRSEKKAEEVILNNNKHRLRDEVFREEQTAIKNKYDVMKRNIITAHTEEVGKINAAYIKEVQDFYQPDGAAIDQNDRLLLESGILKTNEIVGMIEKHKNNTTMLRIISQKASKETLEEMPKDVRTTLHLAEMAGKGEISAFDNFNQLMSNPIRMAEQGLHETATESFIDSIGRAEANVEYAKNDILKAQLFTADEI